MRSSIFGRANTSRPRQGHAQSTASSLIGRTDRVSGSRGSSGYSPQNPRICDPNLGRSAMDFA